MLVVCTHAVLVSIHNSPPNSHGFLLYKLKLGGCQSDVLRTVADCRWQQVNPGAFSTSGSDESTAVGIIIRSITSEIMRGETKTTSCFPALQCTNTIFLSSRCYHLVSICSNKLSLDPIEIKVGWALFHNITVFLCMSYTLL